MHKLDDKLSLSLMIPFYEKEQYNCVGRNAHEN